MKKWITDNPEGNVESAHNLYYIKDKETWVLGGGPAPDYADISLYDFMRRIIKIHGLNICTDDNGRMGEQLYGLLFDNVDSKEGVVALLYASAWAFSELREKLKAYESADLEPEEISALVAQVEQLNEQHRCDVHNLEAMQTTLNQQAKNCEKLLSDKDQQIATLKKALELMAKDFYDSSDDEIHVGSDGLVSDYIEWATQHHQQEADK